MASKLGDTGSMQLPLRKSSFTAGCFLKWMVKSGRSNSCIIQFVTGTARTNKHSMTVRVCTKAVGVCLKWNR